MCVGVLRYYLPEYENSLCTFTGRALVRRAGLIVRNRAFCVSFVSLRSCNRLRGRGAVSMSGRLRLEAVRVTRELPFYVHGTDSGR